MEHEVDRSQVDYGFRAVGPLFPVFAQPAMTSKPGQGALNDPPPACRNEAAGRSGRAQLERQSSSA